MVYSRPFITMGVVRPPTGTFHNKFSPCSVHLVTGAFSRDMPVCSGPRQKGQSAAWDTADAVASAPTITMTVLCPRVFIFVSVSETPATRVPIAGRRGSSLWFPRTGRVARSAGRRCTYHPLRLHLESRQFARGHDNHRRLEVEAVPDGVMDPVVQPRPVRAGRRLDQNPQF